MNVRNCRKCGKLFNYAVGPLMCPDCVKALEESFSRVKAYIEEHTGCGIKEVAEECEVDVNQIQQWLREERLQLGEGTQIELTCESCGALIRSGRFCDKCKATVTGGFNQILNAARPQPTVQKKEKESPRMRFIN